MTWMIAAFALAAAQHGGAACGPRPAPPPAELAGWARPIPLRAGVAMADAPRLTIDVAARATLRPSEAVRLAAPLARKDAAATSGGLLAFDVPAAARYRVALGDAAWIDVVASGRALQSAAHAHGPACTGVRKMVDFDLVPGRYLLQVAGNGAPAVTLMIARLR